MKKILFISTTFLHVRHGGSLANLAYYNAFKRLYGDLVDLAAPEECNESFPYSIPIPRRNRFLSFIKMFQGRFHRYRDFFSDFIKKNAHKYAIVIINGGFYAGDMISLFHSFGIGVIVIHHNFEVEYHLDNKTLLTLGGLTSYFVARNERKAYQQADLNVYLTVADMKLHEQHYGVINYTKSFLLGVFEKDPFLPVEESNFNNNLNIVITGSMNFVQTVSGIMDLKNNYYSIIRDEFPELNLIISGRNPDAKILNFVSQNSDKIKIIANPDDINSVIKQGSIFLCPTNVGGGLKLRLMDGLKNGLPILVHQVSARGYEAFFDQPFFRVYNDKKSFANGLNDLINYIKNSNSYHSYIQYVYRRFFGFDAGCLRVVRMMDLVNKDYNSFIDPVLKNYLNSIS